MYPSFEKKLQVFTEILFSITKVQKVTSNLFEEHEMTESTRLCWRAGLATDTVHHSPRAQVEINEHGN